MQALIQSLRALPADIGEHSREPAALADLSDADLVRAVAQAIARPKRARADSFTIHAPLELLARATLLARVAPGHRSAVRLRIAAIAPAYAVGEELDAPPEGGEGFADTAVALAALLGALNEADAETADAAADYLGPRLAAADLSAALAEAVAPRLGLAAHAPILLAALPGATRAFGDLSCLLRAPLRTLATEGRARLTWIDEAPALTQDAPATLFGALAAPERVASPSVFIAPTMLAVEADGRAARTLGRATAEVSLAEAKRELMRIAALSMLQDDPAHAPYGWTHCLTLPQAVLALAGHGADPRRAIRIAAMQVLGFRATLGRVTLDRRRVPPEAPAPPKDLEGDIAALAGRAGAHRDAHLAKYTLACLEAALEDREGRGLYLAAAAHLAEWWEAHPDAGFRG